MLELVGHVTVLRQCVNLGVGYSVYHKLGILHLVVFDSFGRYFFALQAADYTLADGSPHSPVHRSLAVAWVAATARLLSAFTFVGLVELCRDFGISNPMDIRAVCFSIAYSVLMPADLVRLTT